MIVTVEKYLKAKEILRDYRICGNSGFGCGKVFKKDEVSRTIQYGQEYYWCKECYEKVKNEW